MNEKLELEFVGNNAQQYELETSVIRLQPESESIDITPAKESQKFEGLYDTVNVEGDENLVAENIKKDVSIFGVEGSYEPEIKLQNKNVSITENGTQTISADNGYDGLQDVDITVNVGGVGNAEIDGSLAYNLSFAIKSLIKEIKNLDVSNIPNMRGMFNGCSNLTAISLFGTSNVTNMSYMFQNCYSLSSIPLFDTSSVTDMNNMFNTCRNLTAIPLFDTSSVTDMSYMFQNCYSLTTIPLLDTSSVTNMNNIFYNCKGLTTIPLFDTSSVTNMNYMFVNCSNLTTIPLLDTSSVTNMSNMFYNCSSLTTVPSLDTQRVTNMSQMFGNPRFNSNCRNLSSESLNNVLEMCINATSYTGTKTLALIGLSQSQAETCMTLPNYQAFLDAGWTTGY